MSEATTLSEAQDALAFAYQYGYPLYAYGRFVKTQNSPINTWYNERDVIKPGWTKVVRPNADTLYQSMFVDLSKHDLRFTVPEFDSRFWSLSFYDMYGNNYAALMSTSGDKHGDYRLRYSDDDFGLHRTTSSDKEKGYINSPTPYGVVTTRILLIDQVTDVKNVHRYQDATKVVCLERKSGPSAPPLDLNIFTQVAGSESSPVPEEEQVLHLTAALAPINLSEVITDRGWIAYTLEKAGIKSGKFIQPINTSLKVAVDEALRSARTLKMTAGFVRDLGNNWFSNSSLIQGDFRSFYQARYLGAMRGYLGATIAQCVYPSYVPSSAVAEIPDINIGSRQAILLSFSGNPHLKPSGFWSVSLYGQDQLFIENDLQRYALGDRSGMKACDGTQLTPQNDGMFKILIQPADVSPPDDWKSNWLPAPPGGGVITFTIRLFGAEASMTDGSYVYPRVELIDAITDRITAKI